MPPASVLLRTIAKSTWCAAAVMVAAAAPTSARAFERETVEGRPDTPLFWKERDIAVRAAIFTSEDVAPEAVESAVEASIAEWRTAAADCSDLVLRMGATPTDESTNLFGGMRDGENRIVWREAEWPLEVSPDALAITTTVYRTASGEILDADIDVNGVHFQWSATDDPTATLNDVQNTLTHELGHLLGFAHTIEPEATMYGSSDPGEIAKRSLHADDIAAVCTVYPFGRESPGELGIRSSGLTGESTCAVSGGRGRGGPPTIALLALLLWAGRRRRRRRSASPGRA